MKYSIPLLAITLVTIQQVIAMMIVVSPGESVQTALDSSADGDTILVRPGQYAETLRLPAHPVTLTSDFLFSGDSLDVQTTVLYADSIPGDTNSCVVVTSGNQVCHTILGFTLRGGRGTVTDLFENQKSGGVIYARSSCLSISSCRILDGHATFGGGVAAIGPNFGARLGYVELDDCLLQGCTALEEGGGLFALSCSLVVRNSTLLRDSCFHFSGGIEVRGGFLSASDTRIDSAYGLWSSLAVTSGELNLERCTFSHGDTPPAPLARSFFNIGGSSGRVVACEFSDNTAEHPAGAIYGDTAPEFLGCVFERNTATFRTATVLIGYADTTQFAYNIIRDNVNISGGALQPFQATTAHIHHNLITGNRSLSSDYPSAIMCVSHCNPLIDSNRIENNQGASVGFALGLDEHPWDLSRNWWGHASGPYHAISNPVGQGDTIVSDLIVFTPWLNAPPEVLSNDQERPRSPHVSSWEVLTVYPNPFNGSLVISIAGFARKDFEVALVDLLGRQVASIHRGPLTGTSLHYTAPPGLASGVFFVVARDRSEIQTHKVVFLK